METHRFEITDSFCQTPAPLRKNNMISKSPQSSIAQIPHRLIGKQRKKTVTFIQEPKGDKQSANSERDSDTFISSSTNSRFSSVHDNFLESDIVKDFTELIQVLDLKMGFYMLKRIFKASQYNFDIAKFHMICDGIAHTVVVAEIANGNVVGGYSPLNWNDQYEERSTHYKSDVSDKALLFNLTSRQKYTLIKQKNNKAVIGCKYLGPTFGGGYDFSIGNFANKTYSSSCDFPQSYSGPQLDKKRKLTRKNLIGTSQQLFLIKQWQVFQILSGQDLKIEGTKKSLPSKNIQVSLKKDKIP